MHRFLVDEDLPRSMAERLRLAGHVAVHVREVGLVGYSDQSLFFYAGRERLTIVTADKGFANIHAYPLGTHAGLIVFRYPTTVSMRQLTGDLLRWLKGLSERSLHGLLVIMEPGRIRVRHPRGNGTPPI